MTLPSPSDYYLHDNGPLAQPLRWCWYCKTRDCDNRECATDIPARDYGHSYRAGFGTREAAVEWGNREGFAA